MDDEALRQEWRENGCVLLKNALSVEELAMCRKLFEETCRSPTKFTAEARDRPSVLANDVAGFRGPVLPYRELLESLPHLAKACADVWGSKSVWFYDMEVYHKTWVEDEKRRAEMNKFDFVTESRMTGYHRDTSTVPYWGPHMGNLWITFEACPAEHSIQLVQGSMFGGPLEQAKVPEAVKQGKVKAYASQPGDVVLLHPGTIHGGGTVSPSFKERNTLVLRIFGDHCAYRWRKFSSKDKRYQSMTDGDHFSKAGASIQLHPLVWGPGEAPDALTLSSLLPTASSVEPAAKL